MITPDFRIKNGDDDYEIKYEKLFNRVSFATTKSLIINPTSSIILGERLKDYYEVQKQCIEQDEMFQSFYDTHMRDYEQINNIRRALYKRSYISYIKNKTD